MHIPGHVAFGARTPDGLTRAARLLFWLALVAIVGLNLFNVGQPILEQHGFRQTQTALTAHYLQLEGFSLRYPTPVVGEPWSIPFEFPIYQQIVATATSALGTPLTATGRVINLIFVLLCCIPLHCGLRRLKVDQAAIDFSLALFLTSPIYLFWAGTFMIEGAALCFTLAFLYYAIKVFQRDVRNRDFVFLGAFLALALLQKITTVAPELALFGLVAGYLVLVGRQAAPIKGFVWKLAVSVLVPAILGVAWVKFSDAVKLDNPIGALLTSAKLSAWNYGTLEQRLSGDFWGKVVFNRNIKKAAFNVIGLLFVIGAFFMVRDKIARRVIAAGMVLFVLPFMLFTNLHAIHNYYQTANSVFLSVAVGVAVIYVLHERQWGRKAMGVGVLVAFIASNAAFFHNNYFDLKRMTFTGDERTLAVASYVKTHTPADKPVIWYGFDWSSEPAFYSERRSLTVPDWEQLELDVLENPGRFLKSPPSAIVHCPTQRHDAELARGIAERYPQARSAAVAGCQIHLL